MNAQRLTTAKKKEKLTEEQLELEHLEHARSRILSFWSFRKITTWADYERFLGVGRLLDTSTALSLDAIKQDLTQQLEKIKEKYAIKPEITDRKDSKTQSNSSAVQEDNSNRGLLSLRPLSEGSTEVVKEIPQDLSIVKEVERPTLWTPQEQHPLQKAVLFTQQEEAAKEAYDALFLQEQSAVLVRAGVGTGKTFVMGALLRRAIDHKKIDTLGCLGPWPIIYVTKASIVEQTRRVLTNLFGLDTINDVIVTHYDALRSTFGTLFIDWQTEVIHGEPVIAPKWKRLHPVFWIWDECQALKNTDSLQSRVGQALNDVVEEFSTEQRQVQLKQIFTSATPLTRVCEAKCFAVAARVKFDYGLAKQHPLTNTAWTDFAKEVAAPSEPEEHNEAAVGRLVEYLLPNMCSIKNLRPQFHARNGIKIIDFETPEERKQYQDAWNVYLLKKAQIEGEDSNVGGGRMAILAAFTIFRREAELIRAPWLAKQMYQQYKEGFAPVAACCFKGTISKAIAILIEQYRIPRSLISIIWGGLEKKKKVKKKRKEVMTEEQLVENRHNFTNKAVMSGLSADEAQDLWREIEEMEQEVEEKVNQNVPSSYRLGAQSFKQRQEEIDRFQSGKSLFCFFTFKAGGVGLSLHHTDEMTVEKVRKKKNGYAYEEDIPLIPIRPRAVTLTPTYSAPELVQGLGRCPRLTSLSDTYQFVVFYRDTIEERVAHSVSKKLRCLKKVTGKATESWESIVLGGEKERATTEEIRELPPEEIIKPDNEDDNTFLDENNYNEEED